MSRKIHCNHFTISFICRYWISSVKMHQTESKPHYKQQQQPSYNDKRNTLHQAHLIEPIIRHRIQDSIFYKQYLYLTNELTILPVIVNHVKYISGTDSMGRPSPFICSLLRLLELEPLKEIISICLNQMGYNEFKYLTALVLTYIRLVYSSDEVYIILDEYIKDYRKLRIKLRSPIFSDKTGLPIHYSLTYMDEWVDNLINKDRLVDIVLPRLVVRSSLVEKQLVEPREYLVRENEDTDEEKSDKSNLNDDHNSNNTSNESADYESDSD